MNDDEIMRRVNPASEWAYEDHSDIFRNKLLFYMGANAYIDYKFNQWQQNRAQKQMLAMQWEQMRDQRRIADAMYQGGQQQQALPGPIQRIVDQNPNIVYDGVYINTTPNTYVGPVDNYGGEINPFLPEERNEHWLVTLFLFPFRLALGLLLGAGALALGLGLLILILVIFGKIMGFH